MAAISGTLLAKAALTVASSDKLRKTAMWVVAAVLSPVLVIVAVICGLLSGSANHNTNALDLCFHGGYISADVPAEYRTHIEDMQWSFTLLGIDIAALNYQMEDGDSLDAERIKAVFYGLYFGETQPSVIDTLQFTDCFVTREERTRIIELEEWQEVTPAMPDPDGEDGEMLEPVYDWVLVEKEETYIVTVPIQDMSIIYQNIANTMGRTATQDDVINITEIYYLVKYGESAGTSGSALDDFVGNLNLSDVPFIGADGFCSPVGENWRNMVSSEFGYRSDPFTGVQTLHGGIDFAAGYGTPIYAALDGTVVLVRYASTGYGYYVMLDHGGSFTTLYAHCSSISVYEGQSVTAGQQIAAVGSTGKSTGNHLHFEISINGEKQNPRSYLP